MDHAGDPVTGSPMVPRAHEVRKVRRETHDTFTLELLPREGSAMPFAPGQFNMLYSFGAGEAPISISGDPTQTGLLVHTIRVAGAVTRALCSAKPGAAIGVRGPFGSSWPVEEAEGRDVILLAGGIGLAPLRPALYSILARRRRYGRINLLYGTRTPGDMLYERELRHWRGRFDLDVEVTVDHAADQPIEHVGVVTELIPRMEFEPSETIAFVCGPEVMMRFSVRELLERGVSPKRVYISMERNMQCAIGLCGHCQFGPHFVCKDGPVFPFEDVEPFFSIREI